MDTFHRWTELGLGTAPFRLVGFYSIPSQSLAETNPTAYNNQLAAMPKGFSIGSCGVCGMPLVNNYLVKSSDNKCFAVGCDCVEKIGESKLLDDVKSERLKLQREKRRLQREIAAKERREELEAELQRQRDNNGGFTDYELQQKKIREEKLAEDARRKEILQPILSELPDNTEFWLAIRDSLVKGQRPFGRGMSIMLSKLSLSEECVNALFQEAGM